MALRGRLLTAAYSAAWRGARLLPDSGAAWAARFAGDLAAWRGGRGYNRLRDNLAAVTPPGTDLDLLARAGMRSYARYWIEVFRLQDIPVERIVRRMRVVDESRLREAHAAGRGTILALPHTGNWDHAGAWLVATGVPFTTVAERLRPASLFDQFVAFRTALGMEVLPLTGGERPPFDLLAERLRAGGMLCLLADRDLTATGVRVRFFGRTASLAAGPATLAVRTGATLLPVTLWFDGDGWSARIHPAVEHRDAEAGGVAAMTQDLADAFAEGIGAHPADWHMLQRVFVAGPEQPGRSAAESGRSGSEQPGRSGSEPGG